MLRISILKVLRMLPLILSRSFSLLIQLLGSRMLKTSRRSMLRLETEFLRLCMMSLQLLRQDLRHNSEMNISKKLCTLRCAELFKYLFNYLRSRSRISLRRSSVVGFASLSSLAFSSASFLASAAFLTFSA